MRAHKVFIRHESGEVQVVEVWAMGQNDAVVAASRKNLGGVIFAVRGPWDSLPV